MTGCHQSEFEKIGALRFAAALDRNEVERVAALFGAAERPGKRLAAADIQPIADLVAVGGPIGRIAASLIGPEARPVRAFLDKSDKVNWRLGWHQDRTIAVRERRDVPGFGPWTVKAGQPHVEPPPEITARMMTVRVHVDPVDEDNARFGFCRAHTGSGGSATMPSHILLTASRV